MSHWLMWQNFFSLKTGCLSRTVFPRKTKARCWHFDKFSSSRCLHFHYLTWCSIKETWLRLFGTTVISISADELISNSWPDVPRHVCDVLRHKIYHVTHRNNFIEKRVFSLQFYYSEGESPEKWSDNESIKTFVRHMWYVSLQRHCNGNVTTFFCNTYNLLCCLVDSCFWTAQHLKCWLEKVF